MLCRNDSGGQRQLQLWSTRSAVRVTGQRHTSRLRHRSVAYFLPARRSASAGTSYGPVSVCLSQVAVLSKRTGASGWIFFGKGASIVLFYAALRENSGLSESKGTSLWNFVLHSGIRKFHHNTPIVETCYQLSSATVDALRVINWTIVGQLSWNYLRAPTLARHSLSQWSSSSVYSTIPSRGSVSDSWCFLFSFY